MVIILLSGSVAFPKPITFTNRVLIGCSRLLWYGGRDMCDTVISGHAAPVFHGIGLNLLVFTVRMFQGSTSKRNERIVLTRLEREPPLPCSDRPSHQPSRPQISSTLGLLQQRGETNAFPCWNVVHLLTPNHSDIIFCPPMFVEVWAKDPGKLEHFKTIYGLVCPETMVI